MKRTAVRHRHRATPPRTRRPLVERLESRRLLCGDCLVPDLWDDTVAGELGSDPQGFVGNGGKTIWSANAGAEYGVELMVQEPDGIVSVLDLVPGQRGSYPEELTPFGNGFMFTMENGPFGGKLMFTDATAAGTRLLMEFVAGDEGAIGMRPHAGPQDLTVGASGKTVTLTASHRSKGRGIWEAALDDVALLENGWYGRDGWSPRHLVGGLSVDDSDLLLFTARPENSDHDRLFQIGSRLGSDDVPGEFGARRVDILCPEAYRDCDSDPMPYQASPRDEPHYFYYAVTLGDSGRRALARVGPDATGSIAGSLVSADVLVPPPIGGEQLRGDYFLLPDGTSQFYFPGETAATGSALFYTDERNTVELVAGSEDTYPRQVTLVGDSVFWACADELLVYDLCQARVGENETIRFQLDTGFPFGSFPDWLTSVNDILFFTAIRPETGIDLHVFDPELGPTLVVDLDAPQGPRELANVNGTLYLQGTDARYGSEPFGVPTEDYGDAPDSYETTLGIPQPGVVSIGPRHVLGFGSLRLGALGDAERNGQPSVAADADDGNQSDDEDGVRFQGLLVSGHPATVEVTASRPGLLDIFIDYDIDGTFDFDRGANASRKEYVNSAIVTTAANFQPGTSFPVQAGKNYVTFRVPDLTVNGPTFARFRVSSQGNLRPTGPADDGEVEDYRIMLYDRVPDFGDAPESSTGPSFPTLWRNGGAFHFITDGFHLGDSIDAEIDGSPDALALGDDDADNLIPDGENTDDEDGITFLHDVVPGQKSRVSAVATLGGAPGARLDAWIDFNGDSQWRNEQIFVSRPLVEGVNVLEFDVPAGAATGRAFARFRMSRDGNLTPRGGAPDGEVEDYCLFVGERIWRNPQTPEDVSGNGTVEPIDALIGINYQNAHPGNSSLPAATSCEDSHFLDTNGDGFVTPSDVLRVINYLNLRGAGESSTSQLDRSMPFRVEPAAIREPAQRAAVRSLGGERNFSSDPIPWVLADDDLRRGRPASPPERTRVLPADTPAGLEEFLESPE